MKSQILSLLLLFLVGLGLVACSEQDMDGLEQTKGMELTVSCTNIAIARADATRPGELDYNENLIQTIHYFLYPKGQTNQPAKISGKVDIADGTQGNVVIRVPLNETELNEVLFPRPTNDCEVYLIANLPEGLLTENSDTSLDALKNLVISTDFKNIQVDELSFIMDGQCTATITSRNKTVAAKGAVTLERLAAKFTVRVSVEVDEYIDPVDGKVYTPQVQNMKIYLAKAGSNTTLSGEFATELFDFDQRTRIGTKIEDVDETPTTLSVFKPFYSYPRSWEYDDNALVMHVTLPWVYQGNGETKTKDCYYKVYPSTMQLDRNSWYNLDLNIGVLGSFSQTEEVVELTTFKYKVVDWRNGFEGWDAGVDLEAEILDSYYLIVDQNKYVVNNKNTVEIPFVTSHKCKIEGLKVTKKIFIEDNKPVNKDLDVTQSASNGNWISVEGNTIKLNHTLNNDFESTTNKNYDYSPYTFTFTLCHEDNSTRFQEEITVIQKPAISVTAELNTRYKDSNGTNKDGYVFVNANSVPNYNNTNNGNNFGGVGNLQDSGNNSNPYMYTIEVSVLPEGSEYILGDPRVKYNWSQTDINQFAQAPALEGNTPRKLTNYYGTIKDPSVDNMLSPKFRIGSAHGWVAGTFQGYDGILKRSATYQEDGYPAGRWRLPTKAEIKFVTKLYADGHIPPLFYSTGFQVQYWYSTGKVTPNGNGTLTFDNSTTGEGAVRSVYDEWYWEMKPTDKRRLPVGSYNRFTWGDEIE